MVNYQNLAVEIWLSLQGSANDQDHWIKRSIAFLFSIRFFSWIRIWIFLIYIFCSGSHHTSGDPNLFALDHDHFDFDDMIFLIQIQ